MRVHALVSALVALVGPQMVGLSTASAEGGGELFAVLAGENEIPAADFDGRGVASIFFLGASYTVLCYSIRVDGIATPTLAHIHGGSVADAGGIVVDLAPAPATGAPGASAGCKTVTGALSAQIRNEPWKFYVNVHTGAHPNGAVRGQLFRDTSN